MRSAESSAPHATSARNHPWPRRATGALRVSLRWMLVLGCIAFPWALLAADAAPSLRSPVPHWAIRGLFTAYIGAAVAGVCAYVLLWSATGRLGRWPLLHDQALLAPAAQRWIGAAMVRGLLAELLPPLLILQLLWFAVRDTIAVADVAGLHANVLGLGLALGVARARLEQQVQSSRVPVAVLAVVLVVAAASALWFPPLVPGWLGSRVYGPALVALNPVLAAAEAARIDLLRHGLWYGLSPLATSRFTPPSAAWCVALPFLCAILLAVAFRPSPYRARVG